MTDDAPVRDPGSDALLLAGPVPFAAAVLPDDIARLPAVAVDGGIHAAPGAVLWAGDGDSGMRPADMPAIVKTDQDRTDFAHALAVIRGWRWRELHLAGFWGGRADHMLAVIGELHAEFGLRPQTARAVIYDSFGRITALFLPGGRHRFPAAGAFSVLAVAGAKIDLGGDCAYAARDLFLPPLAGRGVSNAGAGTVALACDAPVLVVFPA